MPLIYPSYILNQVCGAIVAPYSTYCNVIWRGAAKFHVDIHFKLQEREIRATSNACFFEQTQLLFNKENIMNIYKILNICDASMKLKFEIKTKLLVMFLLLGTSATTDKY